MELNITKQIHVEQSDAKQKEIENVALDVLSRMYGDNNVESNKSRNGDLSFSLKSNSFFMNSNAEIIIEPSRRGDGYMLDAHGTMIVPVAVWVITAIIVVIGLFAFFIPGMIVIGVFFGLVFKNKNKFKKTLEEAFIKIDKALD